VLKPDLAITAENITWSPSIIHVGERVNISAKVANVGMVIAANVKVEFQVDNLYYTYERTGQINPGEFYTVYAEWDALTVGPHSFTIVVDPLPREQDEESTKNNLATRQFMVYEESAFKPDLAISNASVNIIPSPPKIGQTITFTAIVSNLGDVAAEEVQVSFYIDGIMLGGQQLIPTIASGEAADSTMTWTAAIGQHVLMVKVDEQDEIDESNESNNNVVREFTVYPAQIIKPNLLVNAGNITISPDPPVKERVLRFNVTVWNLGNDSASDIDVQLWIDGEKLDGVLNIPYLAPGQSAIVTGMWMPSGGVHTFEVTVDPDGQIDEWSTEDNHAQIQVELPADPLEVPWLIILAIVSFAVLAYGLYAYMGKRRRGKAKKPEGPEGTEGPEKPQS
jgi:subtilase family serine protease